MCKTKGSKNLHHIEYVCEKCLKNFGCRKYDYIRHLNKLKPCEKKNPVPILNQNNNSNNNSVTLEVQMKLLEKVNFLIDQVQILKEENEKLKTQIIIPSSTSTNTNSNNTTSTNTNTNTNSNNKITNNIQIVNFDSINYSTIEKPMLINNFIKEQGKQIYLKTIQDIFLNKDKPENHNIYVNDKNRGSVKLYNNEWRTTNFKVVDLIINNITDYYKLSIDEIKNNEKLYEKLKNVINTKIKYINFCDLEYLANLEEEQEFNENDESKDIIQRSREFRKMVFEEIINLLYDKKEVVLNTHKNKL